MSLTLVTPPALEPITLDEAKDHMRIEVETDDALIVALIQAAREDSESHTNRAFITQDWKWELDRFPTRSTWVLRPPKPQLQSITQIDYIDTAGATITWPSTEYKVDAPNGPHATHGRIAPAFSFQWPQTRAELNAVIITFKVGYGDGPGDVPQLIRSAMLLFIAHLYEHRETVIIGQTAQEMPVGAERLLSRFTADRFDIRSH